MRFVKDDILNVTDGIICQQVNCKDVIGAGISGSIVNMFPDVEEDYHKSFKEYTPKQLYGNYRLIMITPTLYVANIYSQFNYGDSNKTGIVYTDIPRLANCISRICDSTDMEVYIPYQIGCGLAGGNWDDLVNRIRDIKNLTSVEFTDELRYEPDEQGELPLAHLDFDCDGWIYNTIQEFTKYYKVDTGDAVGHIIRDLNTCEMELEAELNRDDNDEMEDIPSENNATNAYCVQLALDCIKQRGVPVPEELEKLSKELWDSLD